MSKKNVEKKPLIEGTGLKEEKKSEPGFFERGSESVVDTKLQTFKAAAGQMMDKAKDVSYTVATAVYAVETAGLFVPVVKQHKSMPADGRIEVVSGNAVEKGKEELVLTNIISLATEHSSGPVSRTFVGNKLEAADVEDSTTTKKVKVVSGTTTEVDKSVIIARAEARNSAPTAPLTTARKPVASSVISAPDKSATK